MPTPIPTPASAPTPTPTPTPVLEIRQLHIAYPGQPPLVRAWSHALLPGVTVLQGEPGCGKSTLLRVLAGRQGADAGSLHLCGVALADNPQAYQVRTFTLEDTALADEQATADTIARAQQALPGATWDGAAWQRHLAGFALTPHLAKPLFALSTGGRRKLRLAAALAAGRPLTLLDEPTAGLDGPAEAYLAACLSDRAWLAQRAVVLCGGTPLDALPHAVALHLPLV